MKDLKSIIIVVNLIAVIIFINTQIVKKEFLKKNGDLVYIELKKHRSYTTYDDKSIKIDYQIDSLLKYNDVPYKGYIIFTKDSNSVAKKVRIQSKRKPLNEDEFLTKYIDGSMFSIGIDQYYFTEGRGKFFEKAKYAGVKISKQGDPILIGLYNENLQQLE